MLADKDETRPATVTAVTAAPPAFRGLRGLRGLRAAVACALLLAVLAAPARCQAPAAPAAPTPGPAGRPRGRLLKVPKVYNALITSNEPLLPSRTEQATVGQVLYYPPQHHHGYPASSGPLILPQVGAQAPPLLGPGGPGLAQPLQPLQPLQPQQPLVSLPPQQQPQEPQPPGLPGPAAPALELHLQDETERADQQVEQVTPWPVVYASDVQPQQDPQRYPAGDADQSELLQRYTAGVAGLPEGPQRYTAGDGGQSEALQRYTAGDGGQSEALQRYTAGDAGQSEAVSPAFPAARAVQTVERLANPGQYRPPPAVHIDSIKNNRPNIGGIRDVPPPPLPVGRGRKPPMGPQPLPPGILPF